MEGTSEKELIVLLHALCSETQRCTTLQQFKDGRAFIQLFHQLSKEDFPHPKQETQDSDREETQEILWIRALNNFKHLQEHLSKFLQSKETGMTYQIAVSSLFTELGNSKVIDLLILYIQLMVKFQTEFFAAKMMDLPKQTQEDLVPFLNKYCLENKTPKQNEKELMLFQRIDQVSEENELLQTQLGQMLNEKKQFLEKIENLKLELSKSQQFVQLLKKDLASISPNEDETLKHKNQIEQLKKEILQLQKIQKEKEQEITDLQELNSVIANLQRDNQQLTLKIIIITKLEKKISTLKETMESDRQQYQTQLDDNEKQYQRILAQLKKQQSETEELENKYYELQVDHQNLQQGFEKNKIQSASTILQLQQKVKELEQAVEKFQTDSETQRSSIYAHSPRNLDEEIFSMFEKRRQQDELEIYNVQKVEEKFNKQIILLNEKIKTLDAVITNLKFELQQSNFEKKEFEKYIKTLEGNIAQLKEKTDEEIEQLIVSKESECMLLASVIFELEGKNNDLKQQVNRILLTYKPQQSKFPLRMKNL